MIEFVDIGGHGFSGDELEWRNFDGGYCFQTTETLRTTEGTDFEISSSVISVVLSVSVVSWAVRTVVGL
jgi:hypothetical protein